MGKRELIALLNLSFWCLVMVERLFLAMPRGCLRFVIVVFPDHTHYFSYLIECSLELKGKYLSFEFGCDNLINLELIQIKQMEWAVAL